MKKSAIAKRTALTVAVASAVASAFALTGCSFGGGMSVFGSVVYGKYADADKYTVGSFAYSADEVDSIDIDWVKGDIDFVVTDGEAFCVRESNEIINYDVIDGEGVVVSKGSEIDDDKRMHWYINDGTLMIKFWKSGHRGIVKSEYKNLTVEIPEKLEYLVAGNTAGKITAETITAARCDIETTSGDIDLGNVEVSGKAEIDSTSGKVTVDELKAKNAKIETTSGRVEIDLVEVESSANIGSTSGKVIVDELTAREAEIDTTSGDIEVSSLWLKGNAKIDSASGNVKVNNLLAMEANIETTSGDITVSNANIIGNYSVDTSSGKIDIGGIKAKKLNVESTSGRVNIAIEELDNANIDTSSGDVSIASELGMEINFDTSSGKFSSDRAHTKSRDTYTFGDGACVVKVGTTSGDLIVR